MLRINSILVSRFMINWRSRTSKSPTPSQHMRECTHGDCMHTGNGRDCELGKEQLSERIQRRLETYIARPVPRTTRVLPRIGERLWRTRLTLGKTRGKTRGSECCRGLRGLLCSVHSEMNYGKFCLALGKSFPRSGKSCLAIYLSSTRPGVFPCFRTLSPISLHLSSTNPTPSQLPAFTPPPPVRVAIDKFT